MFFILAALIGEISFMLVSIYNKRMRNKEAQSTSVLAIYGLTSPIWLILAVYYGVSGQIVFTPYYALILGVWLVVNLFFNYGAVYLTRFQSLSEGAGYKFGVSLLFAWLVDLLFFEPVVGIEQSLPILCCFIGGVWLSLTRDNTVKSDMTIPLWQRISFISFLSFLEIIMYSTYKIGAQIQDSPLVHLSLAHAILIPVFLLIGYKSLRTDIKKKVFVPFYIWVVCGLLTVGIFAETYAIYGLPITLLIMFYLIRTSIFAIHDMWTKELQISVMNVSAIMLILSGIIYMSYLKM